MVQYIYDLWLISLTSLLIQKNESHKEMKKKGQEGGWAKCHQPFKKKIGGREVVASNSHKSSCGLPSKFSFYLYSDLAMIY